MDESNPVTALETKAAKTGLDLAAAAADESKSLIRRLLGPWASEAGELMALSMRERRMIRTAETLRRVEEKVSSQEKAGETQRVTVHPRGAIPWMEAASLEDDDDLSVRYVDLLANAVLARDDERLGIYTRILSELTPRDAQLLQLIFHQYVGRLRNAVEKGRKQIVRPSFNLGDMLRTNHSSASLIGGLHGVNGQWTTEQVAICADNLFRFQLLRDVTVTKINVPDPVPKVVNSYRRAPKATTSEARIYHPTRERVALSPLGVAFSIAVNPPSLDLPRIKVVDDR